MSNERWMSKIQHNPRLINMVLPASHDAGVYGDSLTSVACPKKYARTQGSDIFNQALAGSRVYDVRVFLKRKTNSAGNKVIVPTMGHFAAEGFKWPKFGKTTGALGAYGGSFITAVNDAIGFVKTYDTEFIILRISHTKCTEHVRAALSEIIQSGDNADHIYNKGRNIATCRINALRGKVVMVFASEFHTGFSVAEGYLPLYKFTGGQSISKGLCFCGEFKGSTDMTKVLGNTIRDADNHKSHPKDHLHWVYWQQTGGNVNKNTTSATGAHAKLGDFIKEVKNKMDSDHWSLPNVIGHDFVNEQSCKQIFELNPYYGD